MTPQPPTEPTLRKYGMTAAEWRQRLADQGGVCPICEKTPPSGRLVIDHEHVRGWKGMPPEQRRLYVRGLLCWTCNHYALARGMTVRRAANVARYLETYQARRELRTA